MRIKKIAFITSIILITACFIFYSGKEENQVLAETKENGKIVYTMVNACDERQQGDAHILKFENDLIQTQLIYCHWQL